MLTRTIEGEVPTEPLFERLFADAEHAFWLDSADTSTKLGQSSYMGSSLGANSLVLEYDVRDGIVTRHTAEGTDRENGSIFQVLDRELETRAIEPPQDPDHGLIGGFVGYLGYECKADCGATNTHQSDVPDAVQMFANRVIAVDHVHGRTHVMALATGEEPDARRGSSRRSGQFVSGSPHHSRAGDDRYDPRSPKQAGDLPPGPRARAVPR